MEFIILGLFDKKESQMVSHPPDYHLETFPPMDYKGV